MAILNVDWRNKHCSLWSYCSIGFSWLQFCFHHCESMKWCNSCATCTILNTTFFPRPCHGRNSGPHLDPCQREDRARCADRPLLGDDSPHHSSMTWKANHQEMGIFMDSKQSWGMPETPARPSKKEVLSAWGAWQIQLTKSVPLQSVILHLELVWPWIKGMIAPQESTVVLHDVIFK